MPSLIDDLLNPASLPDKTKNVSLVQTHISLVFVADEFVYKVKKAVNFGFLDFSTLDKRAFYCHQETMLNQRLSQNIYLGVLPIFFNGENHKIGTGVGEIVEYAVKMRRIPSEMLMKSVFERGELCHDDLKRIANVLAEFHLKAQRSPEIDKYGEPQMFKINTDENFDQTRKYLGRTMDKKDFDRIYQWTDHFFRQNERLFFSRIQQGKIRDCHGDLHMEHICIKTPIAIFDCIEFNDRFRYTDILADIAFLLMDLDVRGAADLSNALWRYYTELTGDADMTELLTFYKVYRAYVRGKVNSFQLDDDQIGKKEKEMVTQIAARYFKQARSYID